MGKTKMTKIHQRVFLISMVILFISVYIVIFQKNNPFVQTEKNKTSLQKEHISEYMNIKFFFPSHYQIKDSGSEINIFNSNSQISITLNNSNYDNLKEYLDFYDEKRQVSRVLDSQIINNNVNFVSRVLYIGDKEQKSYYYYSNNTIVIASTSSPELYDELDQIATSFEYLGDTKK